MKTTKLIELTNNNGTKEYKILYDFYKMLNLKIKEDKSFLEDIVKHLVEVDRKIKMKAENKLRKKLAAEGTKAKQNGDYEKAKELFDKFNIAHKLAKYEKIINKQNIYCVSFDDENPQSVDILCEIEIWDNLDSEIIEMYKEPYGSEKEFIEVFKNRIIGGYYLNDVSLETSIIAKIISCILQKDEKSILERI